MELLRQTEVERDRVRHQRGEANDGRPAVSEGDETAGGFGTSRGQNRVCLLRVHRERALSQLERRAVEKFARRGPDRPLEARQEQAPLAAGEEAADEIYRGGRREELIVVDHE